LINDLVVTDGHQWIYELPRPKGDVTPISRKAGTGIADSSEGSTAFAGGERGVVPGPARRT
jgi:hypothetical protein